MDNRKNHDCFSTMNSKIDLNAYATLILPWQAGSQLALPSILFEH